MTAKNCILFIKCDRTKLSRRVLYWKIFRPSHSFWLGNMENSTRKKSPKSKRPRFRAFIGTSLEATVSDNINIRAGFMLIARSFFVRLVCVCVCPPANVSCQLECAANLNSGCALMIEPNGKSTMATDKKFTSTDGATHKATNTHTHTSTIHFLFYLQQLSAILLRWTSLSLEMLAVFSVSAIQVFGIW